MPLIKYKPPPTNLCKIKFKNNYTAERNFHFSDTKKKNPDYPGGANITVRRGPCLCLVS